MVHRVNRKIDVKSKELSHKYRILQRNWVSLELFGSRRRRGAILQAVTNDSCEQGRNKLVGTKAIKRIEREAGKRLPGSGEVRSRVRPPFNCLVRKTCPV